MPTSSTPAAAAAITPNLWPRVVAASVAGTSHLRRSQPCQDAHAWQRADGRLVAAVADGAGSASHSDLGAAAAVVAAVAHLVTALAPAPLTPEPESSAELDSAHDSGRNSGHDSGRDSELDSPHDSGRDSGRDSELDSPHDSGRDSERDSELDSPHDSGRDSGRDSGFDTTAASNPIDPGLDSERGPGTASNAIDPDRDARGATGQYRSPAPELWVEPSGDARLATWRSHLIDALAVAQDAVGMNAAVRGVSPRELACTLIVVIADGERVAIAQIGDGAAVGITPTGDLRAFTVPPAAEYANQTHFLTDPQALQQIQLHTWRGSLAGLALFSDGLQRLALQLPAGEPFAPFFEPLFRFVAQAEDELAGGDQLRTFLQSPRVSERTDDDLTLLLANWPHPSAAPPNPEQP